MGSMPEAQKKEFIRTQMIIVKVYAIWMTIQFLIYQVPNLYYYPLSKELSLICLIVVQWILVIGILGVMAHSVRVDKPELNKIVAVLVLLRAYMPLFDIEDRRQRQSQLFNSIFLVASLNNLGI